MDKLYCPECGNYLEGGDGSMVDCHCGWKQERSLSSDEDEIEQLRQRVAELEAERDALKQQRDELLAAAEAIEIDAEECLDFDECTAMLVSIDAYHGLMEAIASINEK